MLLGYTVLTLLAATAGAFAGAFMVRAWGCRWRGHDWFPDGDPMEFLVMESICLRHCGSKRVRLPYGECLNKHPIAEHYNAAGDLIEHPTCPRPM